MRLAYRARPPACRSRESRLMPARPLYTGGSLLGGRLSTPGAVYTDILACLFRGLDEKSTVNDPV